MRCPKCHEQLEYDEQTESYFCEECNVIYSKDELIKPTGKLFIISLLMWIPILNLIILSLAKNKSEDEQQIYFNIAMSSLVFQAVAIICAALCFTVFRDNTVDKFKHDLQTMAINNMIESLPKIEANKYKAPEPIKRAALKQEPVEEEPEVLTLTENEEFLIDGSVISGDKVRDLVTRYDSYGFLLQTTSIRTKQQNMNYYLNVGHRFREAEYDELIDYSYVDEVLSEVTLHLMKPTTGVDKLNNKNTVYYIYDTQLFQVSVLHDAKGQVIGLAFTEQEE